MVTHHGSVSPSSSSYTLEEGQIWSDNVRNTASGDWGGFLCQELQDKITGMSSPKVTSLSFHFVFWEQGLSVVLAVLDHRDSAISAP